MQKGSYKISQLPGPGPDVRVTSGKDASFGACIASILVFFFMCLIIVFVTLPLRSTRGSTSTDDKNINNPNYGRIYGGPHGSSNRSTTVEPIKSNEEVNGTREADTEAITSDYISNKTHFHESIIGETSTTEQNDAEIIGSGTAGGSGRSTDALIVAEHIATSEATTEVFTETISKVSTKATTEETTGGTTEVVTTKETTGGTTEVTTKETTGGTTEGTTGVATEVTANVPTEVRTKVTTEVTAEETTGVTIEVTTAVPTEETTEVTTEITPKETTEVIIEVTTRVTTAVLTEETTEVTTEVAPKETTEVIIEVTTGVTTEVTAEETTGVTTAVPTEETTEVTTEVTPKETTEVITGVTTEVTTGVTTAVLTEETTEVTTEVTPKETIKETTEETTEVTTKETTEVITKTTEVATETTEETTENTTIPEKTTQLAVESSTSSKEEDHDITLDTQEQKIKEQDEELCETGECKSLASRMLSLMNHTVDPCKDFYKYACGGLRHNKGILPVDPEQEVEEKIRHGMSTVTPTSSNHYRQFMHFYESCLTYQTSFTYEQRVLKAITEMKQVGTLYDEETWQNQTFSSSDISKHFTELLVRLFKVHSTPLFDIILDVADTGRGSFALKLTPPIHRSVLLDVAGIGHKSSSDVPPPGCLEETAPESPSRGQSLDLKESYNRYILCTQNWRPFIENVEKALRAFGAFESLPELNRNTHLREIRSLLEDILLLKRQLDWRILIKELLNEEVPDSTQVQVYFGTYFDKLFKELTVSKEEMSTLNNMLLGLFAHELYTGLVIENPACDRAKLCLDTARSLMDDVASLLYLTSFDPEQVNAFKTQSRDIFVRTKDVLGVEMKNAKWMDADGGKTREALLIKLKEMTLELGTERSAFAPEKTMSQIPQNGDFFDTFLALLRRLRKRMYANYFSAPQAAQQLWSHFENPTATSGTAVYSLNSILLPLGVYSVPNYYKGAPKYIHMATLGSLIVHEIAHHFDNIGISFDSKGRKDKLVITDAINTHYEEMLQLADGQYSYPRSFNVESGGTVETMLDSTLSLNERFADQMASYIAQAVYTAWQEQDKKRGEVDGHRVLPWLGMTWRQAFFLAQAQTYCANDDILDYRIAVFEEEHIPPFLRVNNVVNNSKQFMEAFRCVNGQNMNKVPPFPALDALSLEDLGPA